MNHSGELVPDGYRGLTPLPGPRGGEQEERLPVMRCGGLGALCIHQ